MNEKPESQHAHDGLRDLDHRVTKLEAKSENTAANILTLTETTTKLTAVVERLNLTLAGRRECPAPGECLSLAKRLVEVEKVLNIIEKERAVERAAVGAGGWLVRLLLGASVGVGCAALGRWLIP